MKAINASNKKNSLMLVILALIFILFLALIIRNQVIQFTQNQEFESKNTLDNLDIININDPNLVACGTGNCILPGNWKINLQTTKLANKNLKCLEDGCTVSIVTDGNYEFYFSNTLVYDTNYSKDAFIEEDYLINYKGSDISVKALKYKIFIEESDGLLKNSDLAGIKEIYGCLESNLCITTGVIPFENDSNSKILSAFTGLVKNITFK